LLLGYFACYREAFGDRVGKTINWEHAKQRILDKWGSTARDAVEAVLAEQPEEIEEILATYQDCILGKTFSDHLSIVTGLQDALKTLTKKYTLCVTTGMHPETLHKYVMPKFGIPEVFSDIISGYEIEDPKLRKPHPYTANLFMEKHNVKPEETVLVGDAENDVQMANAAKITPIVVLTGHLTEGEAKEVSSDYRNYSEDYLLLPDWAEKRPDKELSFDDIVQPSFSS